MSGAVDNPSRSRSVGYVSAGLQEATCAALVRLWFVFFFSSRRRHTRSLRDWSSDVCSSDLSSEGCGPPILISWPQPSEDGSNVVNGFDPVPGPVAPPIDVPPQAPIGLPPIDAQIGRASCRERVWDTAVAGTRREQVHRRRGA